MAHSNGDQFGWCVLDVAEFVAVVRPEFDPVQRGWQMSVYDGNDFAIELQNQHGEVTEWEDISSAYGRWMLCGFWLDQAIGKLYCKIPGREPTVVDVPVRATVDPLGTKTAGQLRVGSDVSDKYNLSFEGRVSDLLICKGRMRRSDFDYLCTLTREEFRDFFHSMERE